MATPISEVVELALSQEGDDYIFGTEVSVSDSNPRAFDCSELVQWACGRAGVDPTMPDGSWIQARHCNKYALLLPVEEAIDIYGALLFKFAGDPFSGGRPSSAHVAFSLGDGTTMEARSSRHGVGTFSAYGRGWTHAALIPGTVYGYRGVENVPEWGEGVVDWALETGLIVIDDEYPDDFEDAEITMGRLWTLFYRSAH